MQSRVMIALSLLIAVAGCLSWPPAARAGDADSQFFESKIRPVLADKCYSCHSETSKKLKGDLKVDSLATLLKGGESGPSIVPGHPEKSRLIEAVGYGNVDLQMPPKAKLPEAQIADLAEWVRRGAPWPGQAAGVAGSPSTGAPTAPAIAAFDLQKRKADHWAWQPVKMPPVPAVTDPNWPLSPIDRFVLAKLEENHLRPAATADRRTLIRRAYFDLVGLPPSPADVEAFVHDAAPDAFERLVDRLLASPQYGERWGRHWLDLVRYAESYGHEFDYPIRNAWRYRDYVIRAFNQDLPYNQFVTEQIAGDLLPHPRFDAGLGTNESIVGTGFWYLGEQVHAPTDVRQHQADRIDNQVDTFGKAFLGLTLGCARCHDHKFDAISQKDVYGLWGFCQSTRLQQAQLDPHGRIAEAGRQIDPLRADGSRAIGSALQRADDASTFANGLLAARDVAAGQSLELVAAERRINPKSLKRWVAACSDKEISHTTHPMSGWSATAMKSAGKPSPSFDAAVESTRRRLEAEAAASGAALAATSPLADFRNGSFDDWTTTGEAFGGVPTRAGDWHQTPGGPRVTMPGFAHSGMRSEKMEGVLWSRDFLISPDQDIFYHMAGHHGHARVVVDGYFLIDYHSLLFGGMTFKVDDERPTWLHETGDYHKYDGHRAHIEVMDEGEGWIAVDQVRFGPRGATQSLTRRARYRRSALPPASRRPPSSWPPPTAWPGRRPLMRGAAAGQAPISAS